jgi:protein-disulfide isomerase
MDRKFGLGLTVLIVLVVVVLGCSQPAQQPEQTGKGGGITNMTAVKKMVDDAVEYINNKLLQPGYSATLINYTKYDSSFYKIALNFSRNGESIGQQDVFLTLDGDVLVLSKKCMLEINKSYVEDPVKNALQFINERLLRPGTTAQILSTSSFGENLLKLQLEFSQNGSTMGVETVYLTKDGKELIAGRNCVIDIYNKYSRVEVPIHETDPYLGNKSAKVVIVEFSDFACPYCARFENEVLPRILSEYEDKIMFVYKDFPLPIHGESAVMAAMAARCAGDQGKYWEYHKLLFQRQAQWTKNITMLNTYAKELGLNIEEFKTCLDSRKYENEVNMDKKDGMALGVTGTPTIFINGIKLVGYQPFDRVSEIIESELAKASEKQ